MPGSPERPPGADGARPAGGRGSPGRAPSAPGRGARGRPIPCEEENGLLPGRGVPGRRAAGAPGSPPVDPGRGRGGALGVSPTRAAGAAWPGARGAVGRGVGGRCAGTGGGLVGADGAAGADGATGEVAAGNSTATSTGADSGAAGAASAVFSAVFAAATFFVVFFAGGGGSLASFSLSRLSTGASTVEEADRTNSPMSFSMLRTVLLSTPSSFASS
jgi:hypothetical protein